MVGNQPQAIININISHVVIACAVLQLQNSHLSGLIERLVALNTFLKVAHTLTGFTDPSTKESSEEEVCKKPHYSPLNWDQEYRSSQAEKVHQNHCYSSTSNQAPHHQDEEGFLTIQPPTSFQSMNVESETAHKLPSPFLASTPKNSDNKTMKEN
jgi:hypothetical protein